MENIYNNTFLNSLFTSDEFNFIKNMDSDIEYSQSMLEKEQKKRDLIVELINGLNDSIYFKGISQENSEDEQKILEAAQNVFELINFNINVFQSNNNISNSIKQNLVDLLIKIDKNGETISQNDYENEISDLKIKIDDITKKIENLNPKILSNNQAIEEFLKLDSVNNYIKEFGIEYKSDEFSKDFNADTTYVDTNEKSYSSEIETNSYNIQENNNVLLISERRKRVYLPYSKEEILQYLKQYPDQYASFKDVVKKEFIFSSDLYLKHPVIARFREAYSLIRDREAKSVLDAFKFATEVMFHYDLNPVVIAACKSQTQLENYIQCLKEKDLTKFKDFEIKFEVNPLKI